MGVHGEGMFLEDAQEHNDPKTRETVLDEINIKISGVDVDELVVEMFDMTH